MQQVNNSEGIMNKERGENEIRKGSIKVDWTRIDRNEPVTKQPGWTLRDKGEEVAMRDIEKPIEQLLADIHEAHQMREEDIANSDKPNIRPRDPTLLILFTLARTSSMMAKVALGNRKINRWLFSFTVIVTICTIVILVLTWLLYRVQ